MNFEQRLELILFEIKETLLRKNADYGDSFAEQFKEYGLMSYLIRDDDKTRRLKNLLNNKNQVNESIHDSVLDKAGYAILTLMCLVLEEQPKQEEMPIVKSDKIFKPNINPKVPKPWSLPADDWIKNQAMFEKAAQKPEKIHRCDTCSAVLGEVACTNEFGGSYCSGKCSEIGKNKHIASLEKKPPYFDPDDQH